MRSGTVDSIRFKVVGRQSGNRRKMSKKSSVLNGADTSLNYAVENHSVVGQVNLNASYHDHISCAKIRKLCRLMNEARGRRRSLQSETDHMYANCSDLNNVIGRLQQELARKNREISARCEETAKLRARLKRRERKMCLVHRNFRKSDEDSTDNASVSRNNISNHKNSSLTTTTTTAGFSSGYPSAPVLATRYFGRRSKTVPSRALKRRYMGPPKPFPVKKTVMSESSTASVSSTSDMQDTDCQETLDSTEILEDSIASSGIRRVRKRRGRRPKVVPRKMDYLTTDKAYFLQDFRCTPESLSSSEIDVPSWKLKPVTSFYQMEGTENINDSVFARRHQKFEQDERRRKRWDIQRIRDQKALEKKRAREKEKSAQRKCFSFYPDARHIEYIEVTEQLPVLAFGHLIPLFQPCEFCLPWDFEENVVLEMPESPPPPSPTKGRRGRPAIPGPKVT